MLEDHVKTSTDVKAKSNETEKRVSKETGHRCSVGDMGFGFRQGRRQANTSHKESPGPYSRSRSPLIPVGTVFSSEDINILCTLFIIGWKVGM